MSIKSGKIDKLYARPIFRRALIKTPKYKPHQGKQECARRVRQMAKAGAA